MKTTTHTVDMARIFDFENRVTGGGIRTLSAEGGTNSVDNDQSKRLKLLRKFISDNKRPRKNGVILTDSELLAMPYDTMLALYANTPSDDSPDPSHKTGDDSQDEVAVKRQKLMTVKTLSACFDSENKRNRQERPGQQFE